MLDRDGEAIGAASASGSAAAVAAVHRERRWYGCTYERKGAPERVTQLLLDFLS
jgi:hypothetical protein